MSSAWIADGAKFSPGWLRLIGLLATLPNAWSQSDNTPGLADLPEVPPGLEVALFAREPLVRNPCSLAFDSQGRLCVGMGPQYRNPTPETPGDSVVLVLDTDGDGLADRTRVFATGFNAIQGLAWHGRDLWVANSPDLTIVRDLDGDDEADEYVLVYTDLGNIEHALHGLNWAPDGKLYLSKGNSKGLNRPDRYAPKPFRDLWGLSSPAGARDLPEPRTFTKSTYRRSYQDPQDDWGRQGGILRCDDLGRNLEIVSRGFRNPWDITFDDGFNGLGTDNDQSDGDRIFSPFFGADFGWSHAWSSSWTGEGHLPTVPISAPVFPGSGTGVIYCDTPLFPAAYRGVFLINDWLLKKTMLYRPRWEGALLQPQGGRLEEFVNGSKALYRPTDIEVGPDGALYCLGWGREYGVQWDAQHQMANEGRIFRIAGKGMPGLPRLEPRRIRPIAEWDVSALIDDLGSPMPTWRINAQEELVRRGGAVKEALVQKLSQSSLPTRDETWLAWSLGRMAPEDNDIDARLEKLATSNGASLNLRIQSVRILAHRIRQFAPGRALPAAVVDLLQSSETRLRFEVVQAIHQARQVRSADALKRVAARETDRITFYATWKALAVLAQPPELHALLQDPRDGVRRAAVLALADTEALTEDEARPLLDDTDGQTASVAGLWLASRRANPLIQMEPPPGRFPSPVQLDLRATVKPGEVRYTLDGSVPTRNSARSGGLRISQTTTVKARLFIGGEPVGAITEVVYEIGPPPTGLAIPLQPLATPTTLDQALTALPQGIAPRGAELFFAPNGPGCFHCHRVGNRGQLFGPELTGLGARAEARHVAQSILDPNAVITEGFNAHVVETPDGEYSGFLLEETGSVLTLALTSGQRLNLEKRQILRHETLKTSAMPSFAEMLTPAQVADLTAWLLGQKSLDASLDSAPAAPGTPSFEIPRVQIGRGFYFEPRQDRIEIFHSGRRVADFVFGDPAILRPYFANWQTRDGIPATRHHPPLAGTDALDHDTMHPGIWLGFGDISGVDFWRNQGRMEHVRFTQTPVAQGNRLEFATESRLRTPDGRTICQLQSQFVLRAEPETWLLIWDATFHSDDGDFTFGDQEEMGLGARVATPFIEKNGGRITSDSGDTTALRTWGQSYDWCDYSGTKDGRRVGVTLMASPGNFRPSWWHNRDYGVVVANPFGREAMKQGPKSQVTVKRGEDLRLQFGAAIHSGTMESAPKGPATYRLFVEESHRMRKR